LGGIWLRTRLRVKKKGERQVKGLVENDWKGFETINTVEKGRGKKDVGKNFSRDKKPEY